MVEWSLATRDRVGLKSDLWIMVCLLFLGPGICQRSPDGNENLSHNCDAFSPKINPPESLIPTTALKKVADPLTRILRPRRILGSDWGLRNRLFDC